MTDLAVLLVQVQQRFTDFLAEQSNDQLMALASGRLCLSLSDKPASTAAVSPPALGPLAEKTTLADKTTRKTGKRNAGTVRTGAATKTAASVAQKPTKTVTVDPAKTAAALRALDSVDDGMALLRSVNATIPILNLIAAELGIKVSGNKAEKEKKILTQAIGARRKFAGLRKWD